MIFFCFRGEKTGLPGGFTYLGLDFYGAPANLLGVCEFDLIVKPVWHSNEVPWSGAFVLPDFGVDFEFFHDMNLNKLFAKSNILLCFYIIVLGLELKFLKNIYDYI